MISIGSWLSPNWQTGRRQSRMAQVSGDLRMNTLYSDAPERFFGSRGRRALPPADSDHIDMTSQRSDAQIQQDVKDELQMEEPIIHAANIGVTVTDGVVTLTGTVDDAQDQGLIKAAARRIAGVRSLSVELKTNTPALTSRLDGDIERECEDVLRSLTDRAHYQIEVIVSNGWVNLSGHVARGYERWLAEAKVSDLPGVKGVNGQLKVDPVVQRDLDTRAIPVPAV